MNQNISTAANSGVPKTDSVRRGIRAFMAVAIVFVMVASAFAVLNVRGQNAPTVWPSEDSYVPGQVVLIYGKDWASFDPITIELTHPDFIAPKIFVVYPDLYGRFVCSNYTAEGVAQWQIPVQVKASQTSNGVTVEATTQFFDPAITLEGYTLRPNLGWTTGDVKGYNEGDSVPYKVKLERRAFGSQVTVVVGLDSVDYNSNPVTHGVDYLTQYNIDPPVAPFNTWPQSTTPFTALSGGIITDQHQLAYQFDSGNNREILVWQFTLQFTAADAQVIWGAHMAVTDLNIDYLGASYFPGSSLHVRIVSLNPDVNQGNRDVPIALGGAFPVLTPPEMTLDKTCDPEIVLPGDEITFTIEWSNIGQADATCVVLTDDLDWVAEIVPDSFLFWTSEDTTPVTPAIPPTLTGQHFEWVIGMWRGTGEMDSEPVLEGFLQFTAIIVDEAPPGTYWNYAEITYSDDHGGYFPPVDASCPFVIPGRPEIDVEKSGPDYAHVGDIITYTYIVTNTGPVALINVEVMDDVAGLVWIGGTLAVGESVTLTKSYKILSAEPDPLVNIVTATGEDIYGQPAEDSDDWSVEIIVPAIDVEKSADKSCAKIGEEVDYTIYYENTGDTPLYDVEIVDSLLGSWDIGTLEPGSFGFIYVDLPAYEVVADPDGEMPNTVDASGTDILGLTVMDTSSWVVDILHPQIEIEKFAEDDMHCAMPGETVTYWIEVSNPSSDTDMYATVTDDMISASALFQGWIVAGETKLLGPYPIAMPDDMEVLTNTAYVTARDYQFHWVSDESSWLVDIVHPSVSIKKFADNEMRCAAEDELVGYTMVVTNTGDITLKSGHVYDLQTGFDITFTDLAPGASLTYTTTMLMPVGEWFTNTATVDAYDLQSHFVTASSSWTIDIVHPGISIEKYADNLMTCAAEQEVVAYTIVVTNTGDILISSGTISDPQAGLSQPFTDLLPGNSITVHTTIQMPAGETFTNTATVDALDRQGHPVSDESSWTIDIVHPAIDIEKTSTLSCAAEDEEVTFTLTVKNMGDIEIASGVVTDPMTGFTQSFFDLMPGAEVEFTTSMNMPTGVPDYYVLENVAFVEAADLQGHVVRDSDSWDVKVVHPRVDILKTSELRCAAENEVVTYAITVTNIGDITLASGTVEDLQTGFTQSFTDLAPGGYIEMTTSKAMPAGVPDYYVFTNTATVTALDLQGHLVDDESSWDVSVVHARVDITKISKLTCAAEGELVTYLITVTNTGDITLASGEVTDHETGLVAGFGPLAPGGTISYETTIPMPVGVPDYYVFTNTAHVAAVDLQGHPVADEASWSVSVVHPRVQIEKTSELTCAAENEPVEYTITVTNIGDITLASGVVSDVLAGVDETFTGLAPGESISFTTTVSMPTEVPYYYVFTNTATVDALDLQGHEVRDSSSWSVSVVHPGVEIEKTSTLSCAAEDEQVTYLITVTNSGDIAIASGTVTDPDTGLVAPVPMLLPGESVTYTTSIHMPTGVPDGYVFVNTALVVGEDLQGHPVSDSDSWRVSVVHPRVEIEKSSELSCAHEGELVVYTITVTNTGDIGLAVGVVTDTMTGFSEMFFDLMPGDHIDYTTQVVVPIDLPDYYVFSNTATVTAEDMQGHFVSDTSTWDIDILHPRILVTKVGPEWADVGETITYHVTITNTGDTELFDVVAEDSLIGGEVADYAMIAIGETVVFDYQYTVPPGSTCFVNIVTATGHDRQWVYVSDSAEWTVCTYGQVEGYKFADLNEDGTMEQGEPGIQTWVVRLQGELFDGGTYDQTRLTDSSGHFEFLQLEAGDYTLSETMLTGWVAFAPTAVDFSLESGMVFENNFGNLPTGSISGCKFHDVNMNGIMDGAETGVADWTITLQGTDITGADIDVSVLTGPDGSYSFTGLFPGVYYVSEEIRAGWFATTPTSVTVDVGGLETFEVTGVCFGNARFGQIQGYKWLDEYMNGYRDGYEPVLEGWVIWLEGTTDGGQHVGPISTVTGPNGWYAFNNLLPGVYDVWEELPEGWANVTPSLKEITIIEGGVVDCAKFGNVQLGCISGWKFYDWDMDGTKDANEPGIEGWEFTLTGFLNNGEFPWSETGTPVGPITVLTDENGVWTFDDLLPGIYTVTEQRRDHWLPTTPDHVHIWVTSGLCLTEVKFGNVPLTCIQGLKFNDIDGDGIRDEGEPAVAGWKFDIYGTIFQQHYELETDESGHFLLCGLVPDIYVVVEEPREGWMHTTPSEVVVDVRAPLEPQTISVSFGNFKLGKIFGYKFEDVNGNGVLDAGDRPVEGWPIVLIPPWVGLAVTSTDANGYYEFIGLPAGTYEVFEEMLPGWVPQGATSHFVTIQSGSVIEVPTFLNAHLGKVFGYKFEDLNSNGVWDDGEPPIEGWNIFMVWDSSPITFATTTDANGYWEFDNVMPSDVEYLVWEELRPGWTPTTQAYDLFLLGSGEEHRVANFGNFHNVHIEIFKFEDLDSDGVFDPETEHGIPWIFQVTGPEFLTTVVTDTEGYASIILTKAGTYQVSEMLVPGWCPTTPTMQQSVVMSGSALPDLMMFGNFRCVPVTFFKYEDVNSDGKYEEGVDEPLADWTIVVENELTDERLVLVTDEDGLVTHEFCHFGVWEITEVLPEGWCMVTPVEGGYHMLTISGQAINLDLQSEQNFYAFGNFHCAKIVVFKYWDKCSSGWFEPDMGDVPLEGWGFVLLNAAGEIVDQGVTDEDGILVFTVCRAGTYTVVEQDKEGWSHINPANGMATYEVLSGDFIESWFGNYLEVRVPVFKYEDRDSDGVYDEGDRPIEGWHFEMDRIGGGASYSGDTDVNGMLVFLVNRSGLYTITEEDRDDWTHVNPAGGQVMLGITSGTVVPLQEFGNFHNVMIVVFKFDDIDADTICEYDDGDRPIQGWTFYLYELVGDEWVFVESKATDSTGHTGFRLTHAGVYKVVEEEREGWFEICPPGGYYEFEVRSGDVFDDLWFANFKLGKIYGYKWNDLNGDGQHQENEPPLAGWQITFETVEGFFMTGTTLTDANGYYEFTGLPPGLYDVWETPQAGWTPTSPAAVHDVLVQGHAQIRIDFENFERGCIEGYKYEDVDGDGIFDAGDLPLPGWTIYLSITTGIIETDEGPISAILLLAIVQTDENGHYQFCDLGPGIYIVSEEQRTGWMPTTATSEQVVMTSGAHIRIIDFLNFEKGSICGFKFNDLNCNGVWDQGEPPVADWPIHMIKDAQPTEYTTYTDDDGRFCFTGLGPDYYMVFENPADNPDWTPTTPIAYVRTITSGAHFELDPFGNFENVLIPIFKYEDVDGDGIFDNDDVPIEGWEFTVSGPAFDDPIKVSTNEAGWAYVLVDCAGLYVVTEEDRDGWAHVNPAGGVLSVDVLSGDHPLPLMYGNFQLGSIYGMKFYDWNEDGAIDGNDYGLVGWEVTLTGVLVDGSSYGPVTRLTDSHGDYRFDGLMAGVYTVTEALPFGWEFVRPMSVNVDVISDGSEPVIFANVLEGQICGYKFYDKDLDGVMDDDEPGLAGWVIRLDGVRDDGAPIHWERVTDETGFYCFDEVQPGLYSVSEDLVPTWENTTPLPIVVDESGVIVGFDVRVDIGNIRFAKIWGYKFLDTYTKTYPFWPNGVFDEDEYGLGDWEITLKGRTADGVLVDEVRYTDDIENLGYYEFDDLLPGMYWVNETLQHGFYATRPISNLVVIYPFPLGPVCMRIDFGNLVPSKDPMLNFVLREGWNLWSTPMVVNGLTAKGLLAAAGPNALLVTKIDKAGNHLDTYVSGDPDRFDFPVVMGEGYYIYAYQYTVFHLTGELPGASSTQLTSGWNLIGHNGLKPMTASEMLAKVKGASALLVMGYNPDTGNLDTYVNGDPAKFDFEVTPGRGYFVWVSGDGSIAY